MAFTDTIDRPSKPSNSSKGKMFDNPVIERLTRTHISVPLLLFTLISSGLIYYGISEAGLPVIAIIGMFITGLLIFTLIEYIVHRYLFHLPPTTPKREKIAYAVHGIHHDFPKDKDRLAMPPLFSLILASGFYFLYSFIMGNLVFGFLPGFLMGYTAYLGVHYSVHAFQPPKSFLKILWVHHGIHHYKEHDRAFGVSSPLWDLILGTMPRK
jgi:sterol desaturase/sphingolipid hydroxylase (fatty acid hydroxylase superfamily)